MALKDRTLTLTVVEAIKDPITGEVSRYVEKDSVNFFAKDIDYDVDPAGAEFKGIKQSDTLQWYSSEIKFTISGDSYLSPFVATTVLTQDKQIKTIIDLYYKYFHEDTFKDIGKYKFKLRIKNTPVLSSESFIGVITKLSTKETDSSMGLFTYSLNFTGKASSTQAASLSIQQFLVELAKG